VYHFVGVNKMVKKGTSYQKKDQVKENDLGKRQTTETEWMRNGCRVNAEWMLNGSQTDAEWMQDGCKMDAKR
jgi:hypothetical protein